MKNGLKSVKVIKYIFTYLYLIKGTVKKLRTLKLT